MMRQLSSMNRRRDDSFSTNSLRQRRQDATMVEQLLDRLLRERKHMTDAHNHEEEVIALNLAIKAWYNANVKGSADKAQKLLKRLTEVTTAENTKKQRQKDSQLHRHQPDLYSYAYCYAAGIARLYCREKCWKHQGFIGTMRKAESVLESMKDALMVPTDNTLDLVEDMNSLLVIWSNDVNLPDLARNFFDLLTKRVATVVINGGVISCIAKSKSSNDAKKAEVVLRELDKHNVDPDNVIYNQVINIHSKSGARGSAERCEKLLTVMHGLVNNGNDKVAPDVRTYNLVLSAWANEKGPKEAEEVLQRLESHKSINPNSISYITCMDAYARVGDAHNNLRVLSMMEKSFKKGNKNAKPTRRAYTSALNGLAKSGRGDAGARAEALVNTMEKLYKAGDTDMKPDTTVYNILINCHKSSATRAEKVLYKMGKRDVVSYTTVINAYSTQGGENAAKRAQSLLDEMQNDDVEPNAQTFNGAITAWSRSGSSAAAKKADGLLKKMEDLQIPPSAKVMEQIHEPGAALRAEILLKVMHAMYKKGNHSMKPNCFTFTAVITAWARSGEKDAGERAEKLLDGMIKLYEVGKDDDVKPNVFTLTAVVDAYARAGGRDAATKASNVVRKVDPLIKPSYATYNCLMKAWSNSQQQGAARMAENILRKLEDEYQKGNKQMQPTIITYSSCINAWAKSTDQGKAKRAQAVLVRMKQMYESGVIDSMPNTVAYTAVINSCATTYGDQLEKEEAFKIAYSTFKELSESKHASPNHVTYSTFMRAISKLMPEGEKKDALVSSTFRLCIRDGLVDYNSLFHMKQAASQQLCSELLGGIDCNDAKDITIDDLPYSWTSNVEQTSRRKRKHNK
ncbi:pentatricopeptide repeat-containing protein [Skeletonema marinoi]|uniref:Pentatricopeptide repeat-containing protein n=1 Tax=Skeletonema marinoi TaxID=267567 RepID=A0AAD8XWH5_9STRA|nr:pentatricopeptide repeat-containing protein [Skeletonema marinoi]